MASHFCHNLLSFPIKIGKSIESCSISAANEFRKLNLTWAWGPGSLGVVSGQYHEVVMNVESVDRLVIRDGSGPGPAQPVVPARASDWSGCHNPGL